MATDTARSSRRPPGSAGLPGIGETLEFVKDPFAFIQKRRARHGRVFRMSLLGRPMAILIGPDLTTVFMALFAARLVRGYSWVLAEQDLTPNWGLVPPVPCDGLRAVVSTR